MGQIVLQPLIGLGIVPTLTEIHIHNHECGVALNGEIDQFEQVVARNVKGFVPSSIGSFVDVQQNEGGSRPVERCTPQQFHNPINGHVFQFLKYGKPMM